MTATNPPNLPASDMARFQNWVWFFAQRAGRPHLPWRSFQPYHVLVSEIMLQQTQVDRVIPKFENWMEHFPTLEAAAAASPEQILTQWQGLGYNRRGLNLWRATQHLVKDWAGKIPSDPVTLQQLPGIGPYTAAAIAAFAFNQPSIVIETNIRAVFLHHFWPDRTQVDDHQLHQLIQATLPADRPRAWYSALMDYGSYLKKHLPNPTRRSRHHQTQTKFDGSVRQVRGAVIRHLTQHGDLHLPTAAVTLAYDQPRITAAVAGLLKDGLIQTQTDQLRVRLITD